MLPTISCDECGITTTGVRATYDPLAILCPCCGEEVARLKQGKGILTRLLEWLTRL